MPVTRGSSCNIWRSGTGEAVRKPDIPLRSKAPKGRSGRYLLEGPEWEEGRPDATGFSGRKRSWRETKHAWRASEDWVKAHAAIEVDDFIVFSYTLITRTCKTVRCSLRSGIVCRAT